MYTYMYIVCTCIVDMYMCTCTCMYSGYASVHVLGLVDIGNFDIDYYMKNLSQYN